MKEYFGHDYNARHDIKMVVLRAELGVRGYGVYWLLVEELYCNGNSLPLGVLGSLAKAYGCPAAIVGRVVRGFGLFTVDEEGGTFSSERIARSLDERARVADSRKDAASRRWEGRREGVRKGAAGARQADAGGARGDANAVQSDASAVQVQCKTMQRESIKRKIKEKDDDDVAVTRAGETGGGKEAAPPAVPPPAEGGATEGDIGAELRGLLGDEGVRYQVTQKSGFSDISAVEGYIAEFAGQLALEGKGDEHGMRLALHFAYWLAKKRERQLRTNKQTGNHGNQNIGGNNGDGAGLADPAALLGWQYPAAAYGVKPTDAEIREEIRHRNVLQGAYNLLMGSSPGS